MKLEIVADYEKLMQKAAAAKSPSAALRLTIKAHQILSIMTPKAVAQIDQKYL